ncbi:MAG TPA: hypothetical protein VGN26_04010 [Armatimonadota bacterium]|jgi:hypothetical protein
MPDLTPEERERIYLEEKAKREAPVEAAQEPSPEPPDEGAVREFDLSRLPSSDRTATGSPYRPKQTPTTGVWASVVLLLLVSLFVWAAMQPGAKPELQSPDPPDNSAIPAAAEPSQAPASMAHMLCVIEQDTACTEDAERDYQAMLDGLARKFPDGNEKGFGNTVNMLQQKLRDRGIRESMCELGWHIADSVPAEAVGKVGFPETSASYFVLRVGDR